MVYVINLKYNTNDTKYNKIYYRIHVDTLTNGQL